MIKVKFEIMPLDEQIKVIQEFMKEKSQMAEYIADYFGLTQYLSSPNLDEIVREKISEAYAQRESKFDGRKEDFQRVWNEAEQEINSCIESVFGKSYDFSCTAYVNLNPVCPRYLQQKAFDVYYAASWSETLQDLIHEIIHFAWFEEWKKNFPNADESEFEYPAKVWLISELAVDPIFKFSNLNKFVASVPAYHYFYEEKIDGEKLIERVRKLFLDSKDIKEFQEKMLKLFENRNYMQYVK